MAQFIEEGFSLSYEVLKVGSIKPSGSGEFDGTKYSASVKFRAVNITQQDDKEVGLREIEQILEFSVPCETELIATNVSEFLRKSRNNGVIVHIKAGMPNKIPGVDMYKVKSLISGEEFLKGSPAPKAKV